MLAGDCVLSARQRGGKILLFAISPLLQIQLNRAAKFKSEFAKRLRNPAFAGFSGWWHTGFECRSRELFPIPSSLGKILLPRSRLHRRY